MSGPGRPSALSLSLAALALAACRAPAAELDPVRPAGEPPEIAPADPSTATPESIVLATVNGRPLSLKDAMDTFLSSHTGHGVLVRGEPAVRELAGRLVEQALFFAEAETLGIPEDALVREVVDDYRRKTAEIAFWKREVEDRVHVPDEEIEAFYAKTDVALGLSLIETETRAEAEALRERAAAGEDFAELAQVSSIHASSSFGGALPYVRRGELELALEEVAFALEEPGSFSEIVRTEAGFAFVRLEERSVNPIQAPREVAIPQIRQILEGRREDELRGEVEAEMMEGTEVEIDESLLTRERALGEDTPEAVVASVLGETLTLGGLRDMLRLEVFGAIPEDEAATILREIAGEWARNRAVERAVARSGLLEDPEVERQTESFRRDAILRLLYEQYVYADVEVSDEQVREYYDEREDEFTQPPEYRLAYMVFAGEEVAAAVLARARAGEDFGALARESSIDPASAVHGGRIGWVRPGTLLPEVEERAFALEVGALSEPIATPSGTFVVKLLDRREARPVPFEQARRTARGRLTQELQKQAYAEWAVALRERSDATIHEEGVQRAVRWLEEQALSREREPTAGEGH